MDRDLVLKESLLAKVFQILNSLPIGNRAALTVLNELEQAIGPQIQETEENNNGKPEE